MLLYAIIKKTYLLIILIILLYGNSLISQSSSEEKKPGLIRNGIKLNIGGTTSIYLTSVKIGYERRFTKMHSIETEVGYTFYSKEDKTPTKGLYSSLSYNYCVGENKLTKFSIKAMPFYQILFMNHYLKYTESIPNIGEYFEYKKTHYTKERYGLTLIASPLIFLSRGVFLEINTGIGVIFFNTKVPAEVTQETYRNGLFNKREYVSPNFLMNLKVGYAF